MGLVEKIVVNNSKDIKQTEKIQESFQAIPEIVRQKESTNILASVFFVEMLKEKEEVNNNA